MLRELFGTCSIHRVKLLEDEIPVRYGLIRFSPKYIRAKEATVSQRKLVRLRRLPRESHKSENAEIELLSAMPRDGECLACHTPEGQAPLLSRLRPSGATIRQYVVD
jgi:hypothetical protein